MHWFMILTDEKAGKLSVQVNPSMLLIKLIKATVLKTRRVARSWKRGGAVLKE